MQTELPDRIYVVDDGSTDGTAGIVGSISRQHPSIFLIRREDRGYRFMGGGVVEAFNVAYEKVQAEYLPIFQRWMLTCFSTRLF